MKTEMKDAIDRAAADAVLRRHPDQVEEKRRREADAESDRLRALAEDDAERHAVELAAADHQAAVQRADQDRTRQLASEADDASRVARIIAIHGMIADASERSATTIPTAQQALDSAIADHAGVEVLYKSWVSLREASAELWTTTTEGRRMIQFAQGGTGQPSQQGDPLAEYTFDDVCTQALAAHLAPTIASATAAVSEAYNAAPEATAKKAK